MKVVFVRKENWYFRERINWFPCLFPFRYTIFKDHITLEDCILSSAGIMSSNIIFILMLSILTPS